MSDLSFLLPDVGEGLTEAEIVVWKVAVGDVVTLNQALVDIETAKATVELPSPYAGEILTLHGEPGDIVEVGQPLVTVRVAGDSAPASEVPARTAVLVGYGVETEAGPARRQHRRSGAPAPLPLPTPPTSPPRHSPRSTPPIRLAAKQNGVSLDAMTGTGPNGLITRHDLEAFLAGPRLTTPAAIATPVTDLPFAGQQLASWHEGPREERIPVRGVTRSMVEAMVTSVFTAPHAAAWLRVDVTKMVELIAALRSRPALGSLRVTALTVAALAVCDAARHYPGLNSSFDEASNEIIVRRSVALGIAAATPRGLVVPSVKRADELDLISMARALTELIDVTREGRATVADLTGTTITITNVGPFGVDGAMPILPPGTTAIFAMGQIVKSPWVDGDQVVVRDVMELILSFDHRVIDGALASRAVAHVGAFLHDPAPALLVG